MSLGSLMLRFVALRGSTRFTGLKEVGWVVGYIE